MNVKHLFTGHKYVSYKSTSKESNTYKCIKLMAYREDKSRAGNGEKKSTHQSEKGPEEIKAHSVL